MFILGAYPSGVHLAWTSPAHLDLDRPTVRALLVDNEPEVFWTGEGAEAMLSGWKQAVGFRDGWWGSVDHAPPGNNGPSGQWLKEHVLQPLKVARSDCCITDCLNTARYNKQQGRRILDTYKPAAAVLGLPAAVLKPAPAGETEVVQEAERGHLHRLVTELGRTRPEIIVTLGNAALRVLRRLVEIDSADPGLALANETYGREVTVRYLDRQARWLPLVHPRSGERTPKWREIHSSWESRLP